ncbi:nucleoside hydrolase [Secundilactobacillus folii]|uniref:ABC transporter substrate-binding protein n=1 Tax=Secundilactobacillus folii TaxID=2678357 RepID=A0A7X3C202_9LACO|nr:nucleoside hydrolase [Secundilactobacillus folii]MTV82320.1 ABC transporter substrate-binding protein [Secundilactobacillus folii]
MRNVYFNHDGNVDDLVSLLLLLQMPNVHLLGVGAVGADSYVEPAVSASRKIIDLFGKQKSLAVAKSDSRPVHQFPKEWRLSAFSFDDFPILNEHGAPRTPEADEPAHLDLLNKVQSADGPVTLVMTGPLTDLARALELEPKLADRIERLYWMGGTMNNQGNVAEPEQDGTVEWNAYWDPEAVKTVWDSTIDIVMVGLESTDQVPLTPELRQHWASLRHYPAFDLIGQGYSLVHSFEANSTYYLWDVLTTMVSRYPELVTSKLVHSDVLTQGPGAGRTYLTEDGRPITLVTGVKGNAFFKQIDELAMQATSNFETETK